MMLGSLCLLLAFLGTEAQVATSDTQVCSQTESESLTSKNSLLQKRKNTVNSGRLDADGMQAPEDGYTYVDENGYPISRFEKDGYSFIVNVSWAGTGAHLYHHVRDTDMCNAICLKDSSCKGFIFHHQPESDGNYKCYVVTSQGQGTYYNPCCHVGIPWEHTTTTTTTTLTPGMFTLKYSERLANENHTGWVYTDWCIAEINSEFVVEKCELEKPEMNWNRMEEGYYVNSVSGKCMGFGKAQPNDSTAMDGLLVPLDPSVINPVEECAYLDGRRLKIGRTFLDGYTKTCLQTRMPDGLLWWFRCTISEVFEDFSNEGYASKRYLTAYEGTLTRAYTETEVSSSLLQRTSSSGQGRREMKFTDCRKMSKKTCPTMEMVMDIPSTGGARHDCWDGAKHAWWTGCRCRFHQGCGGPIPCLVNIIEVVEPSCLKYETITNTSTNPSVN